jgi:hypothetical protein
VIRCVRGKLRLRTREPPVRENDRVFDPEVKEHDTYIFFKSASNSAREIMRLLRDRQLLLPKLI